MFCKRRSATLLLERVSSIAKFLRTLEHFEKHLGAAASENQYLNDKFRSSRPEVFCKKGALRSFAKFKVKHLWQSLFLIKLQARDSGTRVFLWILWISKNTVEHLWWLLLQIYRREVISVFYLFKPFSFLKFARAEWFCHVTWISKVYLILFSFLIQRWYCYHKKVVTWLRFIVKINVESVNLT